MYIPALSVSLFPFTRDLPCGNHVAESSTKTYRFRSCLESSFSSQKQQLLRSRALRAHFFATCRHIFYLFFLYTIYTLRRTMKLFVREKIRIWCWFSMATKKSFRTFENVRISRFLVKYARIFFGARIYVCCLVTTFQDVSSNFHGARAWDLVGVSRPAEGEKSFPRKRVFGWKPAGPAALLRICTGPERDLSFFP